MTKLGWVSDYATMGWARFNQPRWLGRSSPKRREKGCWATSWPNMTESG